MPPKEPVRDIIPGNVTPVSPAVSGVEVRSTASASFPNPVDRLSRSLLGLASIHQRALRPLDKKIKDYNLVGPSRPGWRLTSRRLPPRESGFARSRNEQACCQAMGVAVSHVYGVRNRILRVCPSEHHRFQIHPGAGAPFPRRSRATVKASGQGGAGNRHDSRRPGGHRSDAEDLRTEPTPHTDAPDPDRIRCAEGGHTGRVRLHTASG